MYIHYIKPFFDLIFSLVALIILFPVIMIISIILMFSIKGNPFFLQQRPGKNAILFTLIKFKTMNDKKDESGKLLSDAERLTKVGRFLRKTSLDELPQLINVLKGDMSIIGPRPLLIQYLPLYDNFQKRRHELKPGITGWAQVNGRNTLTWQQKFNYDVYYVDNCSFLFDLKIFLVTLKKVFYREGINQEGHATADFFKGNQSND